MQSIPITFVMTDVESSTSHLRQLGPAYGEHLQAYRQTLRDLLGSGEEVDASGDGLLLAFADPAEAVEFARRAQDALAGALFKVRIGVHRGDAVAGAGGTYTSLALHQCQRLMAAGHGGQSLVSEAAAAQLPGAEFTDLGRYRLRDFDGPQRIWQVGSGSFPALRVPSEVLGNLPAPRMSFVGRSHELSEVGKTLQSQRLVTLTGPGGVGKTTLALQMASEFAEPDSEGAWLVELASIRPDLVARRAAEAIGARPGPGQDPEAALLAHVGDRRLLLVLDSCEHVLETVALLADRLLAGCPGVRLLATSREALRVRGEWVVGLDPLPQVDAELLFLQRAQAAGARLAMTEETVSAVSAICRGVDGLPLAVELAAARAVDLPLTAIVEALAADNRLLAGGYRTDAERMHSIDALLDWSLNLASGAEVHLFRRLAVFPAPFQTDDAVAVAGCDATLLERLAERSLVQPAGGRYWLLDPVRHYARGRLEAAGDREAAEQAMVAWGAAWADTGNQVSAASGRDAAIARWRLDADNIQEAFQVALRVDPGVALKIVSYLAPQLFGVEGPERAGEMLEAALAAAPEVATDYRGRALVSLSYAQAARGNVEGAVERAREAIRVYEAAGSQNMSARHDALMRLVAALRGCGRQEEALEALQSAGDIVPPTPAVAALYENEFGTTLAALGRHAEARPHLERAVELRRQGNDSVALGVALLGLAVSCAELDDRDAAVEAWAGTVEVFERLGNPIAVGRTLVAQGEWALIWGEPGRARPLMLAAVERLRPARDRAGLMQVASVVVHRLPAPDELRARLHAGLLTESERLGWMPHDGYSLGGLPDLEARIGSERFTELVREGKDLGLEVVLDEALRLLENASEASVAGI